MNINAIQHIALGQTEGLSRSGGAGGTGAIRPSSDPVADFTVALEGALNDTNQTVAAADEVVESFLQGDDVPVHQVMTALAEAGVAMQLTTAVTTRAIAAYQEIARMQI